jgi:transcriptional regulator with XRE-family HTH domain
MDNKKEKFAARLTAAMKAQGYNPEAAVLEREFNLRHYGDSMTLHGVRKWLIGTSIPPYEKIITLAKWLKIPPDDLTFGLEIKQKIKQENTNWKEAISYQEREVFEAFLNLPAPQKKIVREVITAFAKAYVES